MLNVKQGSCEYQLIKSFGLTQPENRTMVYRLLNEDSVFVCLLYSIFILLSREIYGAGTSLLV